MRVKLLDVPRTKTNKLGERVPANPQKGPTCWYYAARLIREAYGRTYSNLSDIPEELREAREIERRISEVRKIETEVSTIVDVEGPPVTMIMSGVISQDLSDKLKAATRIMFPQDSDWNTVLSKHNISVISDDEYYEITPPPPFSKQLMTFLTRTAPRMILLELASFEDNKVLAMYGFKDHIVDPNEIVRSINANKLLLAGGELSHGQDDELAFSPIGIDEGGSINVYQVTHYAQGGHAIVVNGYGLGDILLIFYLDPQYPSRQFLIPYDQFRDRLVGPSELMYLT